MKFQPDRPEGVNILSRHAPGCVWVNADAYEHSVVVPWQGEAQPWGVDRLDALVAGDFDRLLPLDPELVIFGSGAQLKFAPPALLAKLFERRIGVETMDTAAACRTFNILSAEGRRVTAALIL